MNHRRRLAALSEHMETRLVLSPMLGLDTGRSLSGVDGLTRVDNLADDSSEPDSRMLRADTTEPAVVSRSQRSVRQVTNVDSAPVSQDPEPVITVRPTETIAPQPPAAADTSRDTTNTGVADDVPVAGEPSSSSTTQPAVQPDAAARPTVQASESSGAGGGLRETGEPVLSIGLSESGVTEQATTVEAVPHVHIADRSKEAAVIPVRPTLEPPTPVSGTDESSDVLTDTTATSDDRLPAEATTQEIIPAETIVAPAIDEREDVRPIITSDPMDAGDAKHDTVVLPNSNRVSVSVAESAAETGAKTTELDLTRSDAVSRPNSADDLSGGQADVPVQPISLVDATTDSETPASTNTVSVRPLASPAESDDAQPLRNDTRTHSDAVTDRAEDVTAVVEERPTIRSNTPAAAQTSSETLDSSEVDAAADPISSDVRETTAVVPVLSPDGTRVVLQQPAQNSSGAPGAGEPTAIEIIDEAVVEEHSNTVDARDVDAELRDTSTTLTTASESTVQQESTVSTDEQRESIQEEPAEPTVEASAAVEIFTQPPDQNRPSVRSHSDRTPYQLPDSPDHSAGSAAVVRQLANRPQPMHQYAGTPSDDPQMGLLLRLHEAQLTGSRTTDDQAASHTVFGDATRLGIMLAAINHAGRRSGSLINISAMDDDGGSDGTWSSGDRRRRKAGQSRRPSKAASRIRRILNPFEAIEEHHAIPCASQSPDLLFADAASMCVLFRETDRSVAGSGRSSLLGGLLLTATATGVAVNRATRRRAAGPVSRPRPAAPQYSGDTVVFCD